MPHDATNSAGPGRHNPELAMRATRMATMASVIIAAILMGTKLWAYSASHSVAMLATFADSALDLIASLTTFYAVRYAATPADQEHRFGHGKAESFASLFQAVLVAISAALVAREAIARFFNPQPIEHSNLAIMVMVLSIVLTTVLVWWQSRAIAQSGSVAVGGDRAHYLSDLGANASVIISIGLVSYAGFGWADALAGLGISVWLAWGAWGVARNALDQMLDRELPDADRHQIFKIAQDVPGVLSVHALRTRAAGIFVHIQFHVDLDPQLTLAEAHKIVVEIERRLLAFFPAADIIIHPDPQGEAESHGIAHFSANGETD